MLLEVSDLSVIYDDGNKVVRAVNNVSFSLEKGEVLGIIGESGSGKSTLANAIIRAIKPPGKIVSGRVIYKGKNLLEMPYDEFRKIMWKEISYVPQASQNALNPVITVYDSFKYVADSHGFNDEKALREKVNELMRLVGLDPRRVLSMYPFQLSGGMRQRVMIALSMLLDPELIIMDEPTSALDMLNQELILKLIKNINKEMQISIIYITHDILNVAQIADRLFVMYKGYMMEDGKTEDIIKDPLNPYTKLLISSIPPLKGEIKNINVKEDTSYYTSGCPFLSRCDHAFERCKELPSVFLYKNRKVRCWLYEPHGA